MADTTPGRSSVRALRTTLLLAAVATAASASAEPRTRGTQPGGTTWSPDMKLPAGSLPFAAPGPVQSASPIPRGREFYFTRAIYSGSWGRGFRARRGSWATDYPKADRQFAYLIQRTLGLDIFEWENAVSLADPALRNFPFLYALEVGGMALTPEEVRGLREYLQAGGYLVIDDFWGTWQWQTFVENISRVLPGRPIVELPLDHEIFSVFYDIKEIKQVPNVGQGRAGGPTWEQDGYEPHVLGIFDEDGRLMVVINWNTDLGDAWEWAEDPYYPWEFSKFAYEMGANMIIYGMSH